MLNVVIYAHTLCHRRHESEICLRDGRYSDNFEISLVNFDFFFSQKLNVLLILNIVEHFSRHRFVIKIQINISNRISAKIRLKSRSLVGRNCVRVTIWRLEICRIPRIVARKRCLQCVRTVTIAADHKSPKLKSKNSEKNPESTRAKHIEHDFNSIRLNRRDRKSFPVIASTGVRAADERGPNKSKNKRHISVDAHGRVEKVGFFPSRRVEFHAH